MLIGLPFYIITNWSRILPVVTAGNPGMNASVVLIQRK